MTGPLPTIVGEGLRLGPWHDSDAPVVLEMARDPVARAWSASMRALQTLDDVADWLAARAGIDDRVDWAVRDTATDALVGRVGLLHIDRQQRSAEIGYGVHPAHRRQGVARRAARAATAYGFDTLGLVRISLMHAVSNVVSCRVAAASAFRFEGVERSALDEGDGVRHDVHRHARLVTDPDRPLPPPAPAPEPTEISAGGLHLRPPAEEDAAEALLMLSDPETARWNPGPDPLDLASAREWCRRGASWADGPHATYSVLDATTGRLLGNVSVHKIDTEQADAEIGYRVAPWARGRGVASDAVAAVTRWVFGATGLVRIEARHAVANVASCRVAQKAGYRLEGTLRQAFVYGDGVRHDEHVHAVLRSD